MSLVTNKSPWREFSYKQVTLERVQLQTNHPVLSSATNKSPWREFSYKQIRIQLEISHPVHREFNYKQVTLERVQLQINHPVQSSATNKSPCRVQQQTSHPVDFSYKQVTWYRFLLRSCLPVGERTCDNFHTVLFFVKMHHYKKVSIEFRS